MRGGIVLKHPSAKHQSLTWNHAKIFFSPLNWRSGQKEFAEEVEQNEWILMT